MTYPPAEPLHRQFVLQPPTFHRQFEESILLCLTTRHLLYSADSTSPQSKNRSLLLSNTDSPTQITGMKTSGLEPDSKSSCALFSSTLTISIIPDTERKGKYYWRLVNHLFSRIGIADTSSHMASKATRYPSRPQT